MSMCEIAKTSSSVVRRAISAVCASRVIQRFDGLVLRDHSISHGTVVGSQ